MTLINLLNLSSLVKTEILPVSFIGEFLLLKVVVWFNCIKYRIFSKRVKVLIIFKCE